jgi:hypothetical protein
MRKLILILSILLLFPVCSMAAWTINSVTLDGGYSGAIGVTPIHWIKADLSSDGSAETDINLWATLQAGLTTQQKSIIGSGGVLMAVIFKQGTDWNGSADFSVTIYNGYHVPIVPSMSINYDESGATIGGVSTTGGYYDISDEVGHYPALAAGLIIDVSDIGNSGDDIILLFGIMPKGN